MRSTRLNLALETGAIALPEEGTLAVFRPRAEDDLSCFPKERVEIIQGFKPDHDAFAARGYRVSTKGGGSYAAALVCLPRAKAEARALLAQAATQVVPGGLVIVDGQKTDGIDAVLKDLRARVPVTEPLSKAHGKIFSFRAGPGFEDWQAKPSVIEGGFQTMPGVFSASGVDRGSALLAEALPADLKGYVVDLGAGWGYLARAILAHPGVKGVDLVEAEAAALDCARVNVTDPRAQFHWEDATRFRRERPADVVVCNPPFHASRAADPMVGEAFLKAAAGMLSPSGALWLVANRHLPYERALVALFREVQELGSDPAFKIYRAAQPIRARR